MGFKAGEEVYIKAIVTNVNEGRDFPYCVKILNDVVMFAKEEHIAETSKTYEQGLADAWELARKVAKMPIDDFKRVFDKNGIYTVICDCSYEETLTKMEEYEKENRFEAGDEVESCGAYGVVTRREGETVYVMWRDGSCGEDDEPKTLSKTGKHIDIESLLRQIGE